MAQQAAQELQAFFDFWQRKGGKADADMMAVCSTGIEGAAIGDEQTGTPTGSCQFSSCAIFGQLEPER